MNNVNNVKGIEVDKVNQLIMALTAAQKAGREAELLALFDKSTRDDIVYKSTAIVNRVSEMEIPTMGKKAKKAHNKKQTSGDEYGQGEEETITSWYYKKFKKGIIKYLKRVLAGKAAFEFLAQEQHSPWDFRAIRAESMVKDGKIDETKVTETIAFFTKAKLSAADRFRAHCFDKMYQAASMLAWEDACRKVGVAVRRSFTYKKFNVSSTNGGKLIRFYEFVEKYNFAIYSGIGYTTIIKKLTGLIDFLAVNRVERVWLSNVHREVGNNMGPAKMRFGSFDYTYSTAQSATRDANEKELSESEDLMDDEEEENEKDDDNNNVAHSAEEGAE